MTDILVKVQGSGTAFTATMQGVSGLEAEPILRVPPVVAGPGLAARGEATWFRVSAQDDSENPWDRAHALMAEGSPFTAAGVAFEAVEPDLIQEWTHENDADSHSSKSDDEPCAFDDQSSKGGKALGPGLAWNRGASFSGFAAASAKVGEKMKQIRIAHLDTGFDPRHATRPVNLMHDLQRNFVDKEFPNDATDRVKGTFLKNRGHGTGTLSILAGGSLDGTFPGWKDYKDAVGGAPLASVIPIRIADWVVRLKLSTMVQGFDYARMNGANVLSMSMGGVSSRALVDAVNAAYDAGIVVVTAAGNHFSGLPSPKSIVFPARYHRVLAACGVMADGRAYYGLKAGTMQGNHGPASKMTTALGAYTPNVPWSQIGCSKLVDMDGAGTSAATPQIAAACALWLAEYWDVVSRYSAPWMRIEAVRRALFESCDRSTAAMGAKETLEMLGRGVVRADKALAIRPAAEAELVMTAPAKPSWSWLNLIFGGGVSLVQRSPAQIEMFNLELTQMAQRVRAVEDAIPDPDAGADGIRGSERLRYLEAALAYGNPSAPLRRYLEEILKKPSGRVLGLAPDAGGTPIRRRPTAPPTPTRRLRAYALDPSLGQTLDSVALNETTLSVKWEKDIKPGPVGEYLEVVDVDPASNRVYDPVDLNDPLLLAQDGWAPSEGNPKFHQQMVYAVGMTTIAHFERALGRCALWSARRQTPNAGGGDYHMEYVQRLRIYPHAFRGGNAYYSPEKKALMFGYFPARSTDADATAPGSMVFSCLSADIVAHEMTHALLDGLHRRFEHASNPDVLAFHEAFADIVALFQHFTITELVRFEIGRSRGNLSAANLLGGLAKQFGEGSNRGGPLRNYLDPGMRELRYAATMESHARGSILVYAVYEAFLKIVAHQTADLVRIATGGTGVLPDGALHPDLVNRLTREVCEIASDVLHMCIRALDYCPSVDITFGEYLRAIITADRDLRPADPNAKRVAFMEAFRGRGILPRDVRTISEETLAWGALDLTSFGPVPGVPDENWNEWLSYILGKKDIVFEGDNAWDRAGSFQLDQENREKIWGALNRLFQKAPQFLPQFGLMDGLPRYDNNGEPQGLQPGRRTTFEVAGARPARRVRPDGTFHTDIVVVINQRRPEPLDGVDKNNGWFWFRGGATLILDPRQGQVRYIIVKNMASSYRLERQRETVAAAAPSLRALYFGNTRLYEPFAMMHAELSEHSHG